MSYNLVNPTTGALTKVAGSGGTFYADAPIGTISPFGGSVIPSGYLLCDGQAVSRTTYSELFAAIGTDFGSGDGSTTFNVPDLREAVPVGSGTRGSGVTDHDTYDVGQFKDDQLQDHNHRVIRNGTGNYNHPTVYLGTQQDNSDPAVDEAVKDVKDARTGTTTHGKQLGVNYIIKAKQVAVPLDIISALKWKLITNGVVAVGTFSIPDGYTEIFAESTNSFGTSTSEYYYPVIENGVRQKNGVTGNDYCEVDGINRTITMHSANAYCRVYGR